MIKKFLNKEIQSISSGAFILAISSLVSRILGMLRDRLLAGKFGAGDILDIYYTSFQIPDFFYNIFIMGTLAVTFIPIFTSYIQSENKEEAWEFTNTVFNLILITMGIGCSLLMLYTPNLMHLVAPGFSEEKRAIAITTTRIMLISPFIFSISSIFSSILNAHKRFIIISFTPVVYNLGIIMGIYFLAPIFGVNGLSYGVILGAIFHLLIQLISVKNLGFSYRSVINLKLNGVKEFLKIYLPRIIGIDITQASILIGTIIGSTLIKGSITIFNLALNVQSLPLGIFGVSFVSAAFPHLSMAYAKKNFEEFSTHFYKTACNILFFVIPISVFFFILRVPFIELLLSTGKFSNENVYLTSAVFGYFCISFISQSLIPLLLRCFYALHNTVIPVIVNVISILADIIFSYIFANLLAKSNFLTNFTVNFFNLKDISDIRVIGLSIGFSLTSIITFIVLYIILHFKLKNLYGMKILNSSIKFLLASIISGFAISYLLTFFASSFTSYNLLMKAFSLGITGLSGVIIYLVICWLLKSNELKSLNKFLGRN